MALYLDVHRNVKATPDEVLKAHLSDMEAQDKHGVKYMKYWFNEAGGTIFCLVDGPNKEACHAVHREAHGLVADDIIDVESGLLEAFLGGQPQTDLGTAIIVDGSLDGGFRTILFTDLVGSTSSTQQLGDEGAMKLIRAHDRIVRDALSSNYGREVKHTGDGIMASFVSASNAVKGAVAIQKDVASHNAENPDLPLGIRIGMSAGEPVSEARDLFGIAVQLARRVCDSAQGGQILAANVVRELCAGKTFLFQDRGDAELKGFDGPVRIHEITWA